MLPKGATVRVNEDVFTAGTTLGANNGALLSVLYNKDDPKVGVTGKHAFATANGGAIYLSPEQYVAA